MTQSRVPLIIAIVLLLLPVLYVGSYFALVVPDPFDQVEENLSGRYRFGGPYSESLFWPIQQVDLELRPETWKWEQLRKRQSHGRRDTSREIAP